MQRTPIIVVLVAATVSAWPMSVSAADENSVEAAAHGAYLAAINSNDTAMLLADLTDNIFYQAPNEPDFIGKDAVRKWVADYFGAYQTKWEKTSIGFTVTGDLAFER